MKGNGSGKYYCDRRIKGSPLLIIHCAPSSMQVVVGVVCRCKKIARERSRSFLLEEGKLDHLQFARRAVVIVVPGLFGTLCFLTLAMECRMTDISKTPKLLCESDGSKIGTCRLQGLSRVLKSDDGLIRTFRKRMGKLVHHGALISAAVVVWG